MNRIEIGKETIRGDLELSAGRRVQFLDEFYRIACGSPAQVPSEDQLVIPFDGDEAIGVAKLRIARSVVFFLAADKAPQFVTLNIRHRTVVNLLLKKPLAAIPCECQQIEDCVAVSPGDSLNTPHRTAFNEQLENLRNLPSRQVCTVQLFRTLAVGLVVLTAAVSLAALAVFPKSFALRLATVAGHSGPCLPSGFEPQ